MKSRVVIITVFVAMLAAVGLIAAFRAAEAHDKVSAAVVRPAVVRTASLQVRPFAIIESFHGLIQANIRVDLAFQIPGRVSQLGANKDTTLKENDRVEAGQVLAELEPLRYQAAVDQANAQMEEAKAKLSGTQAAVAEAQAKYDDSKTEYTRIKSLQASDSANSREVEQAQMAMKLAEAALDGAKATLTGATAMYESGRASATMANVNLNDATLKAPMAALVAAVPVKLGQMVSPAQPVVTLVDLSRVKLVLGVVERKLPLLKKGQKVKVEVRALASQAGLANEGTTDDGHLRDGVITIVPPAADPITGLFNVEVELPNTDNALRPGMVGKAMVTIGEKKVLAIPAEAAVRSGDQYVAYFVGEGYNAGLSLGGIGKMSLTVPTAVARRVAFKPIAIDKDYYLVSDVPGELSELIVEGQTRLTEGQPVQVVGASTTADADAR